MSEKYDCTNDVMEHRRKVEYWMYDIAQQILNRSEHHDESKLSDPVEKAMFDQWTPELRKRVFGSDEYKSALDEMGKGIKLHYKANRHHPEHYVNGVNDMTLVDLIEMVCDWIAASERNNAYVDLDTAAKRFKLGAQLQGIITNTLRENDMWNQINGVPVVLFCPPDERDGHIEGPFERAK